MVVRVLRRTHKFQSSVTSLSSRGENHGPEGCSKTSHKRGRLGSSSSPEWRRHRVISVDGFTLMELLIVISIILILMLMAVPSISRMKKQANETSAINSVQVIFKAEIVYATSYPKRGFTCFLAALGGDPGSGAPSPDAAQILQADLASGYKSGYIFCISKCSKTNVGGRDYVKEFTVTAVPETLGKTGDRGFCNDESGTPKFDPAGGTNCAQLLQ